MSVPSDTRNGSRYKHTSSVTMIDDLGICDMALLKINQPIPPHYNVHFAGWTLNFGQATTIPYYDIHHPAGDIKKSAKTHTAFTITNYPCHIVTETVDVVVNFLFGWITRKEIRTRSVCRYIESAYYTVPFWSVGVVEPGSSGSALVNANARIIGALSGGLSNCDFPVAEAFGRLNTAWQASSRFRDALRPNSNDFVTGIGGRDIECYENLLNLSGNYYPAKDYQPDNFIRLRANNNITTSLTEPLTIKHGANFQFNASNSVTLSPGFTAESGSVFSASIASSCNSNSRVADPVELENSDLLAQIRSINIPASKVFVQPGARRGDYEVQEAIYEASKSVAVYPNPAKDFLYVKNHSNNTELISVELYDIYGNKKYSSVELYKPMVESRISTENLPLGLYMLHVNINSNREIFKIVVSH